MGLASLVAGLQRLMRGAGRLLLGGLFAGACAAADTPSAPLTIGRVDSYSPLATVSERIVREAFERCGLAVTFKPLPLLRSVESANDAEIDGDLMRIADVAARYTNLMIVPTPINRVDVAIYGVAPMVTALSRAEIEALKIGIPRGTFVVVKHSRGLSTIEAGAPEQAFEMVLSGRADVAMAVHLDTEAHIAAGRVTGVQAWPYVWASEPLYLLLNRRRADLVPRIEAALRQMKQDGLLERYYLDELHRQKIIPLKADALAADSPPRRGR